MFRYHRIVWSIAALGLLCWTPSARATTFVWGDVIQAGGIAGAGAHASGPGGEEHDEEQNPLNGLGTVTAEAQDSFGDRGSSLLQIEARSFRGESEGFATSWVEHEGTGWGYVSGGSQGSFSVMDIDGADLVALPFLVEGSLQTQGIGAGSGMVSLSIQNEQMESIFSEFWDFSTPGDFSLNEPILLDLVEGASYYYTLSGSMNTTASNYTEHFVRADEHATRLTMSVWLGDDPTQPVPEPSTALLLAPALGGLLFAAHRRRRRPVR